MDTNTNNLPLPYLSDKESEAYATPPDHEKPKDGVHAVFDYWVDTCRNSGKGRRPVLDPRRRRKIREALKLYDVDTLKQAIDGVMVSDFHQGDNLRGTVYDELTLILRDAEHVEEFLGYYDEAQ